MFWKTLFFESPTAFDWQSLELLAQKSGFRLQYPPDKQQFELQKPNFPAWRNLYNLQVTRLTQVDRYYYRLDAKPKSWLLILMAGLVFYSVFFLVNTQSDSLSIRLGLRVAIPSLFAIPFLYFMTLNHQVLEIKNILYPGFLDKGEGKMEQFRSTLQVVNMFTNGVNYLYLFTMILFLLGLILWMFDILDPLEILKKLVE